jgi:quinolinate synthase
MAMNTLEQLKHQLINMNDEVFVDEQVRVDALKPLDRLLAFSAARAI